jgi:CRISPR-associated protein Cas2
MRILIFFDLPSIRRKDKREYRKFRNHLLYNGFIMLQESVYAKLTLNPTATNSVLENLRKSKPPRGLVQSMVITEKQFQKIEFIVGNTNSDIINSTERFVVL